jgi:hypothetical protein
MKNLKTIIASRPSLAYLYNVKKLPKKYHLHVPLVYNDKGMYSTFPINPWFLP